MTPYYSDEWLTIHEGDCRAVLREMEPESVHCVVTSPPYWGLRDYGTAGQLGLEETPEAYVAALVDVFREVRRVLRSDGTVWLNLGDSYANDTKWGGSSGGKHVAALHGQTGIGRNKVTTGLKSKDLVGIPWRVAFALQADGWYLRSDIIWSKPNPMPESVTDRPTKSHEYLFLLSKSARYFFDADAVREAPSPNSTPQTRRDLLPSAKAGIVVVNGRANGPGNRLGNGSAVNAAGRNLRSVWTIATSPYPGAHFATFPPKLVEPCIKAGCPDKACGECGAPWERVVERESAPREVFTNRSAPSDGLISGKRLDGVMLGAGQKLQDWRDAHPPVTTGFRPTCTHDAPTVPGVVLDPFAGTGTVGLVAQRLSRRAVLIDINAEYLAQCLARNAQTPMGLVS